MAITQGHAGRPGSEQHMGVDVGAQAGTGRLFHAGAGEVGRVGNSSTGAADESAGGALEALSGEGMKVLKPLPHAVIDYAMAGTMMAAPWLFGFSRNRAARRYAVMSGAGILGLSLMTKYPLGAVKLVSFPAHGVVETLAGLMTAAAPWLLGFSRDPKAKWTHVASGLGTLAVVAVTDYSAAEEGGGSLAGAGGRGELGQGYGGE